jgi:hypothetical protein
MQMIAKPTAYYRALLGRLPMIGQALCWTVVRGVGLPVTVEQVITRIGGDPATLAHRGWDAAFEEHPAGVAHLAQVGSAVVLFEVNGNQGRRPEVLRWLSDAAWVHSVFWHVNGADRLMYAVYGRVLTEVDVFSPERRHGQDPAALDDDLQELVALRADDGSDYRPAAMAVVEARTGVRLQTNWFDQPQLSVLITDPLPRDPHPPTTFAWADPDLHALLSLAGPGAQRDALVRVAGLLAERFDLAGEPEVSQALAALDPNASVSVSPEGLNRLQGRLRADFEAVRDESPMEQNPAWWRMQAASAISAAVGQPGGYLDPLDALLHARHALQTDWPPLRNELRALARTVSVVSESDQ